MTKFAQICYITICLFYLALLCYLILFKGSYESLIEFKGLVLAGEYLERKDAITEPFRSLRIYWSTWDLLSAKVDVVGNIIGFFPFGMLLYRFFHKLRYVVIVTLMAGCFSLGLESIQYIYGIGQFDIDDIILNTLGAIIGYIMIWCTANSIVTESHKFHEQQ